MCQLLSRHELLCTGDAPASSVDLLNQPINERMLEQLLAGEWQVGCDRLAHMLRCCSQSVLACTECASKPQLSITGTESWCYCTLSESAHAICSALLNMSGRPISGWL